MFHVKHMTAWAAVAKAASDVGSKLLDREWGINSANRINDHQYNNSLDYQRNVYSAQVDGLRAAGLNPILAATNGGSFTGSGSAVSMSGSDAVSTASQYELQNAQKQLMREQWYKTVAEENNVTADTRRKEAEVDFIKQQTTNSAVEGLWNNERLQWYLQNPAMFKAYMYANALNPAVNSAAGVSNIFGNLSKALVNSILRGGK